MRNKVPCNTSDVARVKNPAYLLGKGLFLDEFRCKFQRQFWRKLICLTSVFTLNFTKEENENY